MHVTIPLGLIFGGIGLFFIAHRPAAYGASSEVFAPTHPVTAPMESATANWAKRAAPTISAKTVDGKDFELRDRLARGPVFLYFIKKDCPCSVSAQPLFNHLEEKFKGKIAFVGVTDADAKGARLWAKKNEMNDPLIPDPELKIIRAYKATNSAFSALVLPDGTIEKMWPGYSRDYMLDMNVHLCGALGQPVTGFDTLNAPLEKTTGCYFYDQPS